MKIYELFTCPHCKETNVATLRDDTEEYTCEECGKPMDIKIEYEIKVVTKLPTRECSICDNLFIAEEIELDGQTTCPHCGYCSYNYRP